MESDNLRTASLYINNLLLSRGLLRNGQVIDFSQPHKTEEGLEATMGRVMGLVNDLVLRRDRDAEQRENLSATIRNIRSDSLRLTTDHERLQTKHAEAQRRLGLAEATERALKLQLKSAEQAARGLKEEMARMRTLVAQTRAQCANEVRKRERVIEGLKKHAGEAGRQRGSGKAVGVTTITVVAGIGEEKGSAAMSVEDSAYDLRTETNEFLTELARGLSEENEHLGGLVRRTVSTLQTISGYKGQEIDLQQGNGGLVQQIEGSYDVLAGEMDEVIAHLQTLLTNPSFVPLEEVEVREDEIIRLREGWEKMEGRWKEAVQMMDGWRKRMARTGQTINLEELQQGLRLSPVKVNAEGGPGINYDEDNDEGDTQADIDAMDSSGLEGLEQASEIEEEYEESVVEDGPEETADVENINSSTFYVQPLSEQEQAAQDAEEVDDTFNTSTSSTFSPPAITALRETLNNANRIPQTHNAFTTIIEENTWDLAALQTPTKAQPTPQPPAQMAATPQPQPEVEEEEEDSIEFLRTPIPPKRRPSAKANDSPLKLSSASSRLPRPAHQPPMQSPLTMASIAAKLAATEREADAARVRAKLKAARAATKNVRLSPPRNTVGVNEEPTKGHEPTNENGGASRHESRSAHEGVKVKLNDADDEVGDKVETGRKRKATGRVQGRASRRRSTLSPWELESLILGGMSPSKSPAKK